MRISDWSSDVCSSDLVGRHDGQHAGRDERQQAGQEGAPVGDIEHSVGLAAGRHHGTHLSSFPGLNTGFAIHALIHIYYRSEEHTSELQSLMRISYAVFCLKKKKKQNKVTQTQNKSMYNTMNNY